jgi:maltose alpha-D-glucosyltransferase/alpha-amylase
MRYLYNLPTKEGGYGRTGSRTPMQWKPGGAGFSNAPPDKFYLPVDTDPSAPNVEEQEKDPSSLLNTVKFILSLRHSEQDLHAKANLEILHAGDVLSGDRSFFYKRGAFIMGVNPGMNTVRVPYDGKLSLVYCIGTSYLEDGCFQLGEQSFGIWGTMSD